MEPTASCAKEARAEMNVRFMDGHLTQTTADTAKPPRRFEPELIETITKTNRRPRPSPIHTALPSPAISQTDGHPTDPSPNESVKSAKRRRSRDKFAEGWAEWENKAEKEFGKRKHDDTSKGAENKTPRQSSPTARRLRRGSSDRSSPSPETTPTVDCGGRSPLFLEIERATSPITRRRPSWASLRSQHSFKVPELEPIESSESEPASPFSPSNSYSASSAQSHMFSTDVTQVASSAEDESVDRQYNSYFDLRAADKQLRDQALAAFPNDDHHEHVDHFIDREETIEVLSPAETPVEERNARRESFFPESNWGVLDMQRYREKLDQQKEAKKLEKNRLQAKLKMAEQKNKDEEKSRSNWGWGDASPFNPFAATNLLGGPRDIDEFQEMRKSARPPLLGGDLDIPRCASPEPAHMDPTQGCDAVKICHEYLTEQNLAAERGEGLWCGSNIPSTRPSLYSLPNSGPTSRSPSPALLSGGLWGGSCRNAGRSPPPGPVGLFTPRMDTGSPASPAPTPASYKAVLPPTPPASSPDFACIDQKLAAEAAIEEEFGDSFITQVYNYLSLGYPAVGRMFDEELSKISKIPVSELRQDDHTPSARGYIRLGEDRSPEDSITEETCMRWRALRTYIKVWARQHPHMVSEKEGFGAAIRRGSWGQ